MGHLTTREKICLGSEVTFEVNGMGLGVQAGAKPSRVEEGQLLNS